MNFDSFVPDLIVGIVTGLVVGFALFIFESRQKRRETKNQIDFDWTVLAARLELLVLETREPTEFEYQPDRVKLANMRELVERVPLNDWYEFLRYEEIKIIAALMFSHRQLEGFAQGLEDRLATEIKVHLRPYAEPWDPEVQRLVRLGTYSSAPIHLRHAPVGPSQHDSTVDAIRSSAGFLRSERAYVEWLMTVRAESIEFINAYRMRRSAQFTDQISRARKSRSRREFLRHPIQALKRKRRSR